MSIVNHPRWSVLKTAIVVQFYARDWAEGKAYPRARIWAVPNERVDAMTLQRVKMPCVTCDAWIHPFRFSGKRIHFAATCPQEKSLRCSRSPAARDEYKRVIEACGFEPPKEHGAREALRAFMAAHQLDTDDVLELLHEGGL